MPVHSVFVLTPQGKVLFSKYLDPHWRAPAREDDRIQWERVLYRNIHHHLIAALTTPQLFIEDDTAVVYQGFKDVIFVLAGTDECNEMQLADLMGLVQELFGLACDKKLIARESAEAAFLHHPADSFAKFATFLDNLMPQGFVEQSSADMVEKLAKAKPIA